MIKLKYLPFILLLHCYRLAGQTITPGRLTDWSKAGMQDTVVNYSNTVNIMSFGGVADGVTPNDTAFINAMAVLAHHPGTIFFPPGSYMFHQTINLQDSVVIKGAGPGSRLLFDLGGAPQHMINIAGQREATIWSIAQPIKRNDTTIFLDNATGLQAGDWVILYGNDSALITSSWAYGTVGQIFKVQSISGSKVLTDQAIRRGYPLSYQGKLKKILAISGVGIECLYMQRIDSTAQQTANINFNYAVNCHVIGIESNQTNFAHVEIDNSSHLTIRGNHFHHSHSYGGNGQGYGIAVEYTSGDCLIENNVFEHLRHSMLLQAGANGNVFCYNYSHDPYWTEPPFPTDAAGDAVLHGNYPYLNLFEGNILQNIVVDNSHGINGPYNTFFRNRAASYGIVMNSGPATDSMNFTGNEITSTASLKGNYVLTGNGYFEWGNNVQGTLKPAGTSVLPEHSLYLNAPPGFWLSSLTYPNIGTPFPYNAGYNPASLRFGPDCTANPKYIPSAVAELNAIINVRIYPNPAKDVLSISSARVIEWVEIMNMLGQTIVSDRPHSKEIVLNIDNIPRGMYFIRLDRFFVQKIVKE